MLTGLEVACSLAVLRLRFANLLQDGQRFVQVLLKIAAHQGKNLEQDGIANGIEDLVPSLPVHDKLSGTKNSQVLRNIRLFHAKFLNEVAGGEFSTPEQLDNRDSSWMCQSLEYVSLEAAKGIRHSVKDDNIRIFDCSHLHSRQRRNIRTQKPDR